VWLRSYRRVIRLTRNQIDTLGSIRTIDLTTYGRQSGQERRVEIWWFRVDGRFVITGTPGRRDWLANVMADSRVIISANGWDIDASVTLIEDVSFRRRVMTHPETSWYRTQSELDRLVETAPMIEVHLPV